MVNVRGQDVLLPTTIVGSYPRPQFLHGKVFPIGGVNSPEFPDFETRALYRNAVALAIKDMTDAGLDIVTDGCQHYEMESDYEQGEIFHYYLDRLEGFVPYGDRISAGEFDNLPIYKPTCVGPIGWRRPIFKPMVEAVVEQTDKPNKVHPADWVIEAINIAFEGVEAFKVVHICCGQLEGQPGVIELRGAKLFPWLWDLHCDQIQYEMASHGFSDLDIKAIESIPDDKCFGVGVINGKSLVVETPEQVAEGIRKVLTVVPPERLSVFNDCTLTGIKHIVAKRKLQSMVKGTQLVRDALTSA
jgi:5-methyltetrahydropteroyltriglutamate--homocysteine methyltransferase